MLERPQEAPRREAPSPGIPAPAPTGSGAVDESVAVWRALAELGVRDAVLSPGSRSAPLVYALADPLVRESIRPHVRIDERAAAFTALGMSREDPAHPAVVVTTSGTATAHLHAAVMEAHHSRVPLVVITADRPAELRGTGANQTTRQAGLYGSSVRYDADLPAPARETATAIELRTAVGTVARALAAACGAHPGPVHLNLCFRDPLVPTGGTVPAAPRRDLRDRIVLTRRPTPSPARPEPLPLARRAVVVAGDGAGPGARELSEAHDLPLFAEPSSGARSGGHLVPGYPRRLAEVLDTPEHPLRPQQVIVFGHPTLSRPVVGSLLGADDVDVIVIDPTPAADWPDASRRARLVLPAVTGIDDHSAHRAGYLRDWTAPHASSDATPLPWQSEAALQVWEATGPQDVLILGSSSLVRDLEHHAGPMAGTVIAQRGLAGIDGMISAATGYALSRRDAPGRVRLLIGDLTALHDLTGMIIGPEEISPDLDVIVVDDGGGRIFTGLEHGEAPQELLRRFFTTPHGTDIAAAARALGVEARILAPHELGTALSAPAGPGRRLLLVQQDPSPVAPGAKERVVS